MMRPKMTTFTRNLAIALLFAAASTCIASADSYEIKVYPAARASSSITIDGLLDEAAWQNAPVVSGFTYHNRPELVEVQTHVRVLYDEDNLYFGVIADEPNTERITPISQPRDSMAVFRSEVIEIFIDPEHTHEAYYQIAINVAASIYDSIRTDPTWSADVKAATTLADDHWVLEAAVPWADLGVQPEPGMLIGINVCRTRYLGHDRSWSNWSQTAANFHDPDRFGHAVLSASPARIGELADELRLGGRQGPIVIFGPDRFVNASYRSIAGQITAEVSLLLDQLEEARQAEADSDARAELGRRIDAYRREIDGFAAAAAGREMLAAEQWRQMNYRIAELRFELDTAVWEARLTALLSGI